MNTSYCPSCGAQAAPEAAFCGGCGARLAQASDSAAAANDTAAMPVVHRDEPSGTTTPVRTDPGEEWVPTGAVLQDPEWSGHDEWVESKERRSRTPLLVGGAVALALLGGVGYLVLGRGDEQAAPAPVVTVTTTSTSRAPSRTSATPRVTKTSAPRSASPGSAAGKAAASSDAAAEAAAERAAALGKLQSMRMDALASSTFDGHWVAQLNSKADGTTDPTQTAANGTHTFHLTDILKQHQDFVNWMPNAPVRLLKGSDIRDTKLPDPERWWVTIADPGTFSSAADVTNFCNERFGEDMSEAEVENVCMPRMLLSP